MLKFNRAPALDGFRALAVIIVVLSHSGLGTIVPGGFGVTIFFFLSGYLITSLLRVEAANNGRINISAFFVRRIIRIFPSLYITGAIVATLCVNGVIGVSLNTTSVIADALFLTNYGDLFASYSKRPIPMPLWSLDVEEHFYLIFSVIFGYVLIKLTPVKAAAYCSFVCLVVLMIRCANVAYLSDYSSNYYWSHTRIDSILFGCILALWNNPLVDQNSWRPTKWHVGCALVALALCIVLRSEVFRETVRYTIQGAAIFVLFNAVLQGGSLATRILCAAPLRWIALLSYTLYLVHLPAIMLFERMQIPGAPVLGITLSIIYAIVMYLAVEKPLSSWHRRYMPGVKAVDRNRFG